jgi:hypothetical protein
MSNIRLGISINPGVLIDEGSVATNPVGSQSLDILLNPFYAMEQDIVSVFADDGIEYFAAIRKIIFEASIKVNDVLTPARQSHLMLSAQEAFRMKREYVTCVAIYKFGNIFNRDYLKSVKKSKFLADVKVSLEIEKDPSLIKQIAADAYDCINRKGKIERMQ